MKTISLILLCSLSNVIFAQNLDREILKVENQLNFPGTYSSNQKIPRRNIEERLEQNNIHGASVAVVLNGKLHWSKSYGFTDLSNNVTVTNQTLFQCASIGKIMTTIALLQLVQKGALELNDAVNDKLVRWKIEENSITKNQPVTVKHLLSHSSGLTDDYGFLGYKPSSDIPTSLQILNNEKPSNGKKSLEIMTTPGEVERYSGAGFLILQLLIEDLSGQSFSDYVQQNIFGPLEMFNTTYADRPDQELNRVIAFGHKANGKALKNKKYHIYPEKAAAGPWTTAEDLAKLIIGIHAAKNGKPEALLNHDITLAMLSPVINNKGLGVNLKGVNKPDAYWHAGQNLGYTALLYGTISNGNGAVILMNNDGGERLMQEFIGSVAQAYNWPVMKSYVALETPLLLQSSLIGEYLNSERNSRFKVYSDKEKLMLKIDGVKQNYELFRIGNNLFTFKDSQDYINLSFDSLVDASSLIYHESIGNSLVLKKVR